MVYAKTDLPFLRRDLHQHAEPGFCEIRTASILEEKLETLPVTILKGEEIQDRSAIVNYPSDAELNHWYDLAVTGGIEEPRARYFRDHGTAMIVVMKGNRPGPTWGLRADIDALRLEEPTDHSHLPARLGFNSRTGAMHACGHDAHMSIAVGLLESLATTGCDFAGTLKVVFQPAEEGVRGADTILRTGATDDVTTMLGLHVDGPSPIGEVTASTVGGMAVNGFLVEFQGKTSHASMAPEQGRNALLAAAAASLGIMALPRFGTADTRLNVGVLHAGDAVNIVPAHATMEAEARATDDDVLEDLVSRVEQVLDGTASAYGVSVKRSIMGHAVTVRPDADLVDAIAAVAAATQGVTEVKRTAPMGASDDASLFIRNTQKHGGQGAFIMVGANSPAPHHNNYFDVDEQAIAIGEGVLERLIRG
ncbi:MAG: amidohydrolase [Bifidobacteriaceae bacterium]|jgi:aminobenzoyl-glutamate utilization protein A|nr:amidohydrolase [Bifidobacteriaceae bacterium]